MKRLLPLVLLALTACTSHEQKAMEEILDKAFKEYEVVDFRFTHNETLGMQYNQILKHCEERFNMARHYAEYCEKSYQDAKESSWYSAEDIENRLKDFEKAKDDFRWWKETLEHFTNNLQRDVSDTSRVVLKHYELMYKIPVIGQLDMTNICAATFDEHGNLTKMKSTEKSQWEYIMNDIAVPDYYDYW